MGNKRFQRLGVSVVGVAIAATAMTGAGAIAGAAPAPVPGTGSSTGSGEGDIIDLLNTGSSILKGEGGPSGPPAVQKCNESTKSGGDGVTETIHQLGRSGPTSFVLRYETQDVPDRIEVFYQGQRVADTGFVGDEINEGTGSTIVRLAPGADTSVRVRVTGGTGTVWEYTVGCPA